MRRRQTLHSSIGLANDCRVAAAEAIGVMRKLRRIQRPICINASENGSAPLATCKRFVSQTGAYQPRPALHYGKKRSRECRLQRYRQFIAMINDRCIITHNDFLVLRGLADSSHLAELDKADVVDPARVPHVWSLSTRECDSRIKPRVLRGR